jgi:hypothetical protein
MALQTYLSCITRAMPASAFLSAKVAVPFAMTSAANI